MATFTIDLFTGNLYLFSGDFTGSGSTPTSGSTYPQVNLYSDLPPAGSSSGQIYIVRSGSGSYVLNRKDAGMYYSNGVAWSAMPLISPYFSSANFQVYDSVANNKGIQFITSGITSGVFRKLKVQNSDGTLAYLTDLQTKVDTGVFVQYTGTTAPATFLTKTAFGIYTGTTVPANYYNKTQINAYTASTLVLIGNKLNTSIFNTFTGTTLPANYYNKTQINAYTGKTQTQFNAYTASTNTRINNKQNTLIAGVGITIIGDTISATGGGGSTTTLQLLDVSGGINVNTISSTPINWTLQVFSGSSLSFTGGSRIYVNASGVYDVSYAINLINTTNTIKNIGSVIRKNGNTDITPLSSSSISTDTTSNASTNVLPQYMITLTQGDYFELMAFRIGNSGVVNTKANSSWITIKRIS